MRRPLGDEDLLERAAIDGRVAFAATAFLFAAGLVLLLDRVGAPERFVGALGPLIAVLGLAAIGVFLRTMRVSRFHAAGRAMPAAYAGLATVCLAVGLFVPFLPPVAGAMSPPGLLLGFGGGLALAAFVTGPLLRKTGAFSIPDLVAARFPNTALRLGVVVVVASVCALVALAGYAQAVSGLAAALGLPRALVVWGLGIGLMFVAAPGGLAGAAWAAAGAAGLFAAGLAMPLALMWARGDAPPIPVLGDRALWDVALTRMIAWQGATEEATHAMTTAMILALVIGLGALAPLLAPAIATRDGRAAGRAGAAALFWSFVAAVLLATTMAASTLAFERGLVGARPGDLPSHILVESAQGRVRICGAATATAAAAREACAARPGFPGTLRPQDVSATGAFLARALPETRGYGAAFEGLTAAGLMSAALALAAVAFHALATALGHDLFYRVRDSSAMTSRRLAVTRLLLVASIAVAGVLLTRVEPDPRALIGLAIALCAAAIAPLLVLSLWPRAESPHATIALLAGLAAAEGVLLVEGGAPTIELFARAAIVAAGVSLASGVIASLFSRPDPASRGGAFVHGVLHGESDVLDADRGA